MLKGVFEGERAAEEEATRPTGVRTGYFWERDGDQLHLEIDLEMRQPLELAEHEYLHLQAIYRLDYEIPGGKDAPSEELEAFTRINGTYTLWPFWREFVKEVAQRMSLSSLGIVPLIDINDVVRLAGYENSEGVPKEAPESAQD